MGKPLRVLLVEDSETDALLTIRALTRYGYDPLYERVETDLALRKALKEKSWDIVLCDYALPRFDGRAAITLLRDSDSDLPLIIISGAIGEETAVECLRLGAQDYIMKGNLSRLGPAIERELEETVGRREKKLAENSLLESEERFRHISQTISDFAYSCSKRPNEAYFFDWITGAVESITGHTGEEITDWGCWKAMVFEEDLPLFMDRVTGLAPGGLSVCELRIRHKEGGIRWLRTYNKTVTDHRDPSVLHLYGACQDITERKSGEEKIRHRNEELAALNRLSREISTSLSLETVSASALREMVEAVKADLAFLFLREEDRLVLAGVLAGAGREPLGSIPEHRVGECLCGLAVKLGEPVYSLDILNDSRCTWEECKKAGLRSLAAFPLYGGDEIIGVIGLASATKRDFEKQDRFLQTLAGAVSLGIDNARLFNETKQSEEALRKSESKYRRLHDSMRDAFVSVDMTGRILDFNEAYEALLGYSKEELGQLTIGDLTPERWHSFEADLVKNQILTQGYSEIYEKEYRRKDGTIFPVELRTFLIRDDEDLPIGMWAIVRDISERKKTEGERLRLISAIEQSADTIVITDTQGTILYVNPFFTTISGYTPEEVVGQNPRILKSGLQKEALYQELWETITGGRTWQGRLINRKKNGGHYTEEATISPVCDNTGAIVNYVAVKRDITEHLRFFEEKEKLQSQFLQAQKMESVGRLAGGVAHDFNNMLGVIIGRTELAMLQLNPSEPLHAVLEEIYKAARRSADLTRQLLAFARKQIVMPQVQDLNDTVEGILKMLRRLIGEDINLTWTPGSDLWPVKVDPSQIDQILANLSVNARDAITGVGKITIKTENVTVDESYSAKHLGLIPGPYVNLTVSDDGCGMDKETLTHLFEPFFTTKELGRGTGLGLATVYGIVKQNNGFINVYSEPGEGTSITIYLPKVAGETGQTPTSETAEPLKGLGETILLVDDDEAVLSMGKEMLEKLGYTVLAAWSPEEALRLAQKHLAEIDLLITDVVLPEMNGRILAEQISRIKPDLKCLFMSGYTPDIISHRGRLVDGVQFVQKPFLMNDLALRVRKILDQI